MGTVVPSPSTLQDVDKISLPTGSVCGSKGSIWWSATARYLTTAAGAGSLSTISCSRDLALIRSESFSDNSKHKLLLNKLFPKVNNNKVNRFNNNNNNVNQCNNSNVNQCNNNNANQYNNSNKHPQFLQGQKFSSMWPQIISNLVRYGWNFLM